MELRNLSIKKRTVLFEKLNMTFVPDNIYYISAPNGKGKTTLFRTIIGIDKPMSGSVIINEKMNLFYFETSNWFDSNLSGYDYLKFIKKMWKSDESIDYIINFWDMNEWINIPIKKYSLGMKQKLLISCYYISSADIWLLDEPSNGLDITSQKTLNILLEQEKIKKIIVIVSHSINISEDLNGNVYTIKDKKLERVN